MGGGASCLVTVYSLPCPSLNLNSRFWLNMGLSLPELSEAASDPLELDENYVVQKLTMELPVKFDVFGK